MFIKKKSTNLFKKSATLSLMKLKSNTSATVKTHTEEKPATQKRNRKADITNNKAGE